MLGALTQDLASPLQALFIKGVCSVLQAAGYTLSILWAEEHPEKKDEVVRNFLMSEIAVGYILGAPLLTEQTIETFSNSHPILSFRTIQKELDNKFLTLGFDTIDAFKKIWQVMPKELEENIIFTGPLSPNTTRKKELFCSCSPNGKLVKTLYYPLEQTHAAFHYDYLCARNFFSQNWKEIIDARLIVCASDLVAHALCDELTSRGKKIGEDIFVIGYDNLENTSPYPGKEPYL
jgi:DNA-binding LacI/PurR family transcriptional regulator